MINKIKVHVTDLALVFMLPMFLTQVLPGILLLVVSVILKQDNPDNQYIIFSFILSSLIVILCSIIIYAKTKTYEFTSEMPKFYMIIVIGCILCLFLLIDNVISQWMMLHVSDTGMMQRTESLDSLNLDQNLLLYLVYALLIAPVAEEFLFRVALYPYLKKSMNWIAAMLFTSVSFGAIHMTVTHLITATLFGILLVLILERTKCIWFTIICHIFYNMAVVFLDMERIKTISGNNWIVFLLTLCLIVVLSVYIIRQEILRKLKNKSGG